MNDGVSGIEYRIEGYDDGDGVELEVRDVGMTVWSVVGTRFRCVADAEAYAVERGYVEYGGGVEA